LREGTGDAFVKGKKDVVRPCDAGLFGKAASVIAGEESAWTMVRRRKRGVGLFENLKALFTEW
jgi:hypothetical protein